MTKISLDKIPFWKIIFSLDFVSVNFSNIMIESAFELLKFHFDK